MSTTATETPKYFAAPAAGGAGITLLEAYSALASRNSHRMPAIAIPFPGQPSGTDPESRLWTIKLQNVG